MRNKTYIEFYLTFHCNLKCSNCSMASPYFSPSYNNLETFKRDCDKLKEFYTLYAARFTGGEALLHPDIVEFITYPKKIGLAEKNCVITNGICLLTAKDDFWEAVDYIHLSVYNDTGINYQKIYDHIKKKQQQFPHIEVLEVTDPEVIKRLSGYKADVESKGAEVNLSIGTFKKLYSTEVKTDIEAQDIYNKCWMKDSTFAVHDGKFYKCPISLIKSKLYRQENLEMPFDFDSDAIDLFDTNAQENLDNLLNSNKFLQACKTCNGYNTAIDEPQSQLKIIDVRDIL